MQAVFDKLIPTDAIVVSFKWNDGEMPDEYGDALNDYVSSFASVIASIAGLHKLGKAEKPHSHYTFIVDTFHSKPVTCNPTDHRKKWCKRTGRDPDYFKGKLSVKISAIDSDKPLYYPLAYPLKEGHRIAHSELYLRRTQVTEEHMRFLEEVGTSLYSASKSKQEARDKDDNKKKRHRTDLLAFCKDNRNKFSNYQELVLYLDDAYYAPIPFEEKPDLANYKKNIQIVAVELSILKASAFIIGNARL